MQPRSRACQLYPKSRKESGMAFGPGRQVAFADLMAKNAKNFEEHGADYELLAMNH